MHTKNKKTYNNVVSVIRCAFDFGYKDHPQKFNPASGLNTLRITKKDRPAVDPFTIQEGEAIIADSHREFGLAHGNYEEFRFFNGLRPGEQIALEVRDCDLAKGKTRITHVRVLGREKDRTKTSEDREISLCPRAFDVLKLQMSLRDRMTLTGRIRHDNVFFQADGAPGDGGHRCHGKSTLNIAPLVVHPTAWPPSGGLDNGAQILDGRRESERQPPNPVRPLD